MRLVREGYETAFEEIVRRYGRQLTRYAAGIVGSRSEDVTQDAFSKALLALRRDDAEIELRPWLYRIVRNTALNDLRDSPPAPEVLAEAIAASRGTAEEAEQREELAALIKRLRALPETQRAAIVMRELEGLGHDEIAAALGLSGGAARQVIYRARRALRDGMGMLVPMPLLRLLIDHDAEATAGVGAGAGGAIVAGGTGAGGMLKAGAVAAVLAGSVGAGIVAQDGTAERDRDLADPAAETAGNRAQRASSQPLAAAPQAGLGDIPDRGAGAGWNPGSGETAPGVWPAGGQSVGADRHNPDPRQGSGHDAVGQEGFRTNDRGGAVSDEDSASDTTAEIRPRPARRTDDLSTADTRVVGDEGEEPAPEGDTGSGVPDPHTEEEPTVDRTHSEPSTSDLDHSGPR